MLSQTHHHPTGLAIFAVVQLLPCHAITSSNQPKTKAQKAIHKAFFLLIFQLSLVKNHLSFLFNFGKKFLEDFSNIESLIIYINMKISLIIKIIKSNFSSFLASLCFSIL